MLLFSTERNRVLERELEMEHKEIVRLRREATVMRETIRKFRALHETEAKLIVSYKKDSDMLVRLLNKIKKEWE